MASQLITNPYFWHNKYLLIMPKVAKMNTKPFWFDDVGNFLATIHVADLLSLCDPLIDPMWYGVNETITVEEIRAAELQPYRNHLPETWSFSRRRQWHIGRIAYLAEYGWTDPINLEIGTPVNGWPAC
jgi:hypothetical protein